MNSFMHPHPSNVPTLTEVIEFNQDDGRLVSAPAVESPLPTSEVQFVAPEPEVSEAQLSQRILTDVQRQIDAMLEFRLRESMQPLLAQFTETLMQDLRDELSRTMRDVVTRAVAQEAAKLRNQR